MQNDKDYISPSFEKVLTLIGQEQLHQALDLLKKLKPRTDLSENARAVCLLRLGLVDEAVSVLKEIVFKGFVCIPAEVPVAFQLNYATAMLLANRKDIAFSILKTVGKSGGQQAENLEKAIKSWVKQLNLIEKLSYYTGTYPAKPVTLDFVPGVV